MNTTAKPLSEHKQHLAKRDRLIRAGRDAGLTQRDVQALLKDVSVGTVARVWNADKEGAE